MKKVSVLFFAIFFSSLGWSQSMRTSPVMNGQDSIAELKTIKEKWGIDISELLQGTDSVECFLLDGKNKDSQGIAGYKTIKKGPLLSQGQIMALIDVINDTSSYWDDSFAKSCYFEPNIAYKFNSKNKHALLVGSLSCDIWDLGKVGSWQREDLDKAHDQMQNLAKTLFTEIELEGTNNDVGDVEGRSEPTIIHTIKKGETLSQIAKKYKVNLEKIASWNNISNPDLLVVGKKITIKSEQ
jgi:hypothetical protein